MSIFRDFYFFVFGFLQSTERVREGGGERGSTFLVIAFRVVYKYLRFPTDKGIWRNFVYIADKAKKIRLPMFVDGVEHSSQICKVFAHIKN